MLTKEEIIEKIQKWANENNGRTPSEKIIKEELEIPRWTWTNYWTKATDMQRSAELNPQVFDKTKYTKDDLCNKFIEFLREKGHWPSRAELDFKHKQDITFPASGTFYTKLGQINNGELVESISMYIKNKSGYNDILSICNSLLSGLEEKEKSVKSVITNEKHGFVYMFKTGRYYKVGCSEDTARRYRELSSQFPDELKHKHKIETDDPLGVESYWHKRFKSKHIKGEIFNLDAADVKAFKRWKRIF